MQWNDSYNKIHTLTGCKTPQSLLDTARLYLRSPLILADLTCHILAVTGEASVDDPRWTDLYATRSLPLNIINISIYQSSLRTGAPVLTTDTTGLPIVRYAVAHDEKIIGYLLSPCYGGEPTEEEMDLIALTGDLCSIRMQKDLHYADYPENILEFFVSDLLNGTITDEQTILDRCRHFNWNLKMPYRVLTIRTEKADSTDGGEEYLQLERLRKELLRRFPQATAFLYGNQLKLIIHVHDQTTRDAIVLTEINQFLTENQLLAGVSQSANRLKHISSRHQQAAKALQMGRLLRGTGPLYHYDAYSIYHCLELCAPHMNLLQLCHSAVLKLESYDRKNGTELMETLHAYLSCHQNVSEAAQALYIHRNTLSKRLEKINDMIRLNFSDAETVFHLMFSFRIIEYYGATVLRDSYSSWVEKSPTLRHP